MEVDLPSSVASRSCLLRMRIALEGLSYPLCPALNTTYFAVTFSTWAELPAAALPTYPDTYLSTILYR